MQCSAVLSQIAERRAEERRGRRGYENKELVVDPDGSERASERANVERVVISDGRYTFSLSSFLCVVCDPFRIVCGGRREGSQE